MKGAFGPERGYLRETFKTAGAAKKRAAEIRRNNDRHRVSVGAYKTGVYVRVNGK